MKSGDLVTIYEDPLTCEKPEGKARLVRRLLKDHDDMEYWCVDFSTGERCDRWIKKESTTP